MGDGCQMAIRFASPIFCGFAGCSDCATDKDLSDPSIISAFRKSHNIGRYRNLDAVDIQGWAGKVRRAVLCAPHVEFVARALEGFDHVDTALRVVTDEWSITGIISPILQIQNGGG